MAGVGDTRYLKKLRLEEAESLLRELPAPVLERALEVARASLSGEDSSTLERLRARDVESLRGLSLDSLDALTTTLFRSAAAACNTDDTGTLSRPLVDDDDDDGPLPAEAPPAAFRAAGFVAATPADAPSFGGNLASGVASLVLGMPASVLAVGLDRALARLAPEDRERLTRHRHAPELLAQALQALPPDVASEVTGTLLEVAAAVALEESRAMPLPVPRTPAPDAPRPRPRPRRAPEVTPTIMRRPRLPSGQPLVLEPGERFEVPTGAGTPPRQVTVERRLADGGGGVVYLARDAAGTPLVIKTNKVAGEVPLSLRVERAVLEPLDHPNLVRLLGTHEDGAGNLLLFLELLFPNPVLHLSRPQLPTRLRQRLCPPGAKYLAPPPSTALELVHDLCRGLEALHKIGFVHNDVKLANFLIAVDHSHPEIPDDAYFMAVASSAYHGVLIDAGGIRNLDTLAEMNAGVADPALPPVELTPPYAPPEALLGLPGDPNERPYYSPAADVYSAALVAYSTFTGYAPYTHLRRGVDFSDLNGVMNLKRAERRGEVSPLSREAFSEARFQDTRFTDFERAGYEACRRRFDRELADVLFRRVDPDPERRGTVEELRLDLERLFGIRALPKSAFDAARPIGGRGPRLYRQFHFAPASMAGSRLMLAAQSGQVGAAPGSAGSGFDA